MRIERRYTVGGSKSPYDLIEWRKATSEIKNPDGSIVFRMEGIEVPASWSQVAVDVLAQKYFRKAGVPKLLERVAEEGIPRFVKFIKEQVGKHPFDWNDQSGRTQKEVCRMLEDLADEFRFKEAA
jgi:hypothetical protein